MTHGVPLIVDNTFATPVNCRPFEWGADIVVHSTTKYMDGHALAVGGAIVDSGNFDWNAQADKFPGLTTPDASYHGIVYTERFGLGGAYITKCVAQLMRDFGSAPAPMNAFLLNIGLETLPLRMKKHCANAKRMAEYLEGHEKVAWVRYPGLPGDKQHERAAKYLPGGTCGVLTFGIKGGRAAAEAFMAGFEARRDRHPCGGCQDLRAAPRFRHAPPDERRGTRGGRGRSRLDPLFRRNRRRRRSDRRRRAGPRRRRGLTGSERKSSGRPEDFPGWAWWRSTPFEDDRKVAARSDGFGFVDDDVALAALFRQVESLVAFAQQAVEILVLQGCGDGNAAAGRNVP